MSGRTFRYALTSAGFWLPVVIGGVLVGTGITFTGGAVIAGIGLLNLLRVTLKRGLHTELLFDDDKKGHGVKRGLKTTERRHLDQIGAYCKQLRETALDPGLAKETWDKAWELVRTASGQDGTKELQRFIHSLPPLDGSDPDEDVRNKIQKDLEHRRKIEKELDLL